MSRLTPISGNDIKTLSLNSYYNESYGGVFSMKRVSYSVETKYKPVEMKSAGFSI